MQLKCCVGETDVRDLTVVIETYIEWNYDDFSTRSDEIITDI